MNSYNTVNAAYRAAGLEAREGAIHGRDWFIVEDFRLDLRAHGRDAAAVGNTDDPFNCRPPYTPEVAASQAQGTRLLGAGGVAAAGGTSWLRKPPTPIKDWE